MLYCSYGGIIMKNMTLFRAAEVCGGRLCGVSDDTRECNKIVIDSRFVEPGDLFAAYKGERVDGHDYIWAAIEKGAACCLAQRLPDGVSGPVLLVEEISTLILFRFVTTPYRAPPLLFGYFLPPTAQQ